tara:strand:+ start:217 stop:378 length:162 start_codon:yes stop_codon:yes gene_type:complete
MSNLNKKESIKTNRELKKRINKAIRLIDLAIKFDSNFKEDYEEYFDKLKEILS